MKVEKCPICKTKGSLHVKWVLNGSKSRKRYTPYYYIAHWISETRKIRWCYINRETAATLMRDALPNTPQLTQEEQAILNAKSREEPDRAKIDWAPSPEAKEIG